MKFILIIFLIIASNPAYSQNDNNEHIYFLADQAPEFLHSALSLGDFIKKDIPHKKIEKFYPLEHWQDSMTAKVKFAIVFDSEGNVLSSKIINGDLLPEITDIIQHTIKDTKWKPAIHNGKAVSYKSLIAICLSIKHSDFMVSTMQEIYDRIDGEVQLPEFDEGKEAWIYYIKQGMKESKVWKKLPHQLFNKTYTFKVRFIINPDGQVSNPVAVEAFKIPTALINACIKIISNCPKWNPAMRNGIPIPFIYTQEFTWYL